MEVENVSANMSEHVKKTGNANMKAETACKMRIARAMTVLEMLFLSALMLALTSMSISISMLVSVRSSL